MTKKPRWASCLGRILPLLLLLLLTASAAQAAGIGVPLSFRPAPPVNPAGPTGWLCQSNPYMPCRHIRPPGPPADCFEWARTPGVSGVCFFLDGYEIDWLSEWRRCGGVPCDLLANAPRLSAGPSESGAGTHWRLDVAFAEAGCTPGSCAELPIGELAPGEVAEMLDAEGAVILSVPDTGFSLLTPGDAACQP